MKNYYSINEDFFDDVETSEIDDTEIGNENEPFVETVPSDLNESIKLEFGIIITNLKKVTDIIKKIEPYIKYTLDTWNGLRYYEKFTYTYEGPYEKSDEPEIIKENGITFKCYTNRYKRGVNLCLEIPCKFNTNSPIIVYNVIGRLFNGIYKKAHVDDNTITGIVFKNDDGETAQIDKLTYNFHVSNAMRLRYIGDVMKVVIGIDGSIGKIFKYLRYSPAHIFFNNLSANDFWIRGNSERLKDAVVKFAENIPMERLMQSIPNNPKVFENLFIFDPVDGRYKKYSFHEQSYYCDSIWNNPKYKELYNDLNYFLKEKNLKFDVFLRKPWDSRLMSLYVCPRSSMVTDFFAREDKVTNYDDDNDIYDLYKTHKTEICVAFECEPIYIDIFLNDDIYNKKNIPMFMLMMKIGNITFDEVIDFFKKNFGHLFLKR